MPNTLPSILPPFDPADEFSCPFGELGLCDDPTHLSCEQISSLPYTTSPSSQQNYTTMSNLYLPQTIQQTYQPTLASVKSEDILPLSSTQDTPPTPSAFSFALSTPALSPEDEPLSDTSTSSPTYLDTTYTTYTSSNCTSHSNQTQQANHPTHLQQSRKLTLDSRTAHSRVEKKYRNSINGGIARLEKAIPHLSFYSKDNDKRPTKSTVLAAAFDHITNLQMEKERLTAELATLRQAVRMLRGRGR